MKVLFTKKQLNKIITEVYSDPEIDRLLDKINDSGYESLSDKEKSYLKGDPMDDENDENNNDDLGSKILQDIDVNQKYWDFLAKCPEFYELPNDTVIELNADEKYPHLVVTDGKSFEFYVKPFYTNDNQIDFETEKGEKIQYNIKNENIINDTNYSKVAKFIFTNIIPKFIEKIKTKNKD